MPRKRGMRNDSGVTPTSLDKEAFNGLSIYKASPPMWYPGQQPGGITYWRLGLFNLHAGGELLKPKAEAGWINFESLIFINSSVREKYKEMTQLPSELHCGATALQFQVHNTILIDQEGVNPYEER